MSRTERRIPVLALSACSIPVMLAFAGQGVRSTTVQSPSVTGEGAIFNLQAQPGNRRFNETSRDSGNCTGEEIDALADSTDFSPPWMCMSLDGEHFWVAKGASISTYRFARTADAPHNYVLVAEVATVDSDDALDDAAVSFDGAAASFDYAAVFDGTSEEYAVNGPVQEVAIDSPVSLQVSEDGQWLYQLFEHTGAMAVYEVRGGNLTCVEWLTA